MPTFTGTAGDDSLAGSTGTDLLRGLAGNDIYIVNSTGDRVEEAEDDGNDLIIASVLDDSDVFSLDALTNVERLRYAGTATMATLLGNSLSNTIEANAAVSGSDTLFGGAGNDTLFGHGGVDVLFGGSGNDRLDGGAGADRMNGGAGNDTYLVDSAGDRISEVAGGGTDTVLSSVTFSLDQSWAAQIERLTYTGVPATTLTGNTLGNVIVSQGAGADTLSGGAGNDRLDGGAGNDRLIGGTGDDTYVVTSGDRVTEIANEGRDTLEGSVASLSATGLSLTIENLVFTATGNTALTGNTLANVIEGGSGDNTISGLDGNDSLAGGAGADRLLGGAGADRMFGGSIPGLSIGADRVNDTGIDTLEGGAGHDVYVVSDTLDVIVEGTDAGTDVVISALSNRITRYSNVEALVLEDGFHAIRALGGTGNDSLVGNDGDNIVRGGSGSDLLSGWGLIAGNGASDVIFAGDGNDVLVAVRPGAVAISVQVDADGGAGNDLYLVGEGVSLGGLDAGGTDTLVVFGHAATSAPEGVETVHLFGAGGARDAAAVGAFGRLAATLGSGAVYDPTVIGLGLSAIGNDQGNSMFGNLLANTLLGGGGNDRLFGGDGNDLLNGNDGNDTLSGGRGDDTYEIEGTDVVVEAVNQGIDVIRSATVTSLADYANVEGLYFTGSIGVTLTGSLSRDILGGGSGGDVVIGQGGIDSLYGGANRDQLFGGSEDDLMFGGTGNDSLSGALGDDYLSGGAGDDDIDGGGNWDTIEGEAGDDRLTGGDGRDTLFGGAGNDILSPGQQDNFSYGGSGDDLVFFEGAASTSDLGDVVWGDDQAGFGKDTFISASTTGANGLSETFVGSGDFQFKSGATIHDFQPSLDLIGTQGSLVGNGDTLIDGAVTATSQGNFSAAAEVVFFRSDIATSLYSGGDAFTPISATATTDVIGTASAAMGPSATKLFVLDDAENSAIFLFQSNNSDTAVTADELYLVAVVAGTSSLVVDDLILV